jgi:hypothetical protein
VRVGAHKALKNSDILVDYIPSERLLMEGDLVTAAFDWQHWPDGFRHVIAKYDLNVERVSPVHNTGCSRDRRLSLVSRPKTCQRRYRAG